ncbi:hypothetical protein ACL1CX_12645 [Corynebacterium striatum]
MSTGRFTNAIQSSKRLPPEGVSKKEGKILFFVAVLMFLFIFCRLTTENSTSQWGIIVHTLAPIAFLLLVLGAAFFITKNRKVQPRGWRKWYLIASLSSIILAAFAEFFWTSLEPHLSELGAALIIALFVALPFAALAGWKMRVGR